MPLNLVEDDVQTLPYASGELDDRLEEVNRAINVLTSLEERSDRQDAELERLYRLQLLYGNLRDLRDRHGLDYDAIKESTARELDCYLSLACDADFIDSLCAQYRPPTQAVKEAINILRNVVLEILDGSDHSQLAQNPCMPNVDELPVSLPESGSELHEGFSDYEPEERFEDYEDPELQLYTALRLIHHLLDNHFFGDEDEIAAMDEDGISLLYEALNPLLHLASSRSQYADVLNGNAPLHDNIARVARGIRSHP